MTTKLKAKFFNQDGKESYTSDGLDFLSLSNNTMKGLILQAQSKFNCTVREAEYICVQAIFEAALELRLDYKRNKIEDTE